MACKQAISEIVENARMIRGYSAATVAHLETCGACREYKASQEALAIHLRTLRGEDRTFEDHTWRKALLMREFDANRRREKQVRWMWAMSSAAVLLLSVVAVRDIRMRPAQPAAATISYAPREYAQEPFVAAEQAGESGFVKVPFAMPTAPGETLGIVQTQMDAGALASMGVNVDPELTGSISVDLLVGEDGLAQAVRLASGGEASAF